MDKRFEEILSGRPSGATLPSYLLKILKDKETGVLYLLEVHHGGLTVMVDKDGKPLTK